MVRHYQLLRGLRLLFFLGSPVWLRLIGAFGWILVTVALASASFYLFEKPACAFIRSGCRRPASGWPWPHWCSLGGRWHGGASSEAGTKPSRAATTRALI